MIASGYETPTLPEEDVERRVPQAPPSRLALAIAWYAAEPGRVGEIAFLTSEPRVFGRGPASGEDVLPRLELVRERGGRIEHVAPLASQHLSRVQLTARELPDGGVEVENRGRLRLLVHGRESSSLLAREGDVLELGAQLGLVVVRRSSTSRRRAISFAFGEADENGCVGESSAAWALRDAVEFVAGREGHVLVRGPSGAGKELVAKALHMRGSRATGPFVARNAATFPKELIDAELFGHARNFPNANMPDRPGLVGEADGGTLFLDELAELPLPLQAHLLRVLDSGEYQRLGESRARRSSFRLIAATNAPMDTIKHDLAARLIHRVEVPSLDARREDVPLLTRHLLRRMAAGDPQAGSWLDVAGFPRTSLAMMRTLVERTYPTNTRQLESLLWRAIATSRGDSLDLSASDSEQAIGESKEHGVARASTCATTGEAEAARVQACLDEHNGALEDTWRALGLSSRHALGRLIKRYGLVVRRRTR
jgi:DNA-binding NtrC family response regulator